MSSPNWGILASATSVALVTSLLLLDANPTLFLFDRLIATDRRLSASLSGKNVWITGASSGIGAELATQLSYCGANVILSARTRNKLDEVAQRCREQATKNKMNKSQLLQNQIIHSLPLDMTASDRTLENAVKSVLKHLPSIDILVLNAGAGQRAPALLSSIEHSRQLMEVNFFSPLRLATSVIKRDRWSTRRRGHVVITSSVAGKIPVALSSSYAASKHALQGFFNTLRSEYGFLRVDLVCPGPVHTHLATLGVNAQSLQDDGHKMAANRCARLILSGMVGPRSLFYETWISPQPVLTFAYLYQYAPTFSNALFNKLGQMRVQAWERGLPLYKLSTWLQFPSVKE